jgi:hypothetical protein
MGDMFFGPFSGASLAERRARWAAVNPPVQMCAEQRRKRRKIEERARRGRFEYEYVEGDPARFRLDPSKSPWWADLNHPDVVDETSSAGRKFRHKFRLPYSEFTKLVTEAQKVDKWCDKPTGGGHGRGPGRHPLVLKVLAVLRHLGKGMDPESLEDGAQISCSTLQVFIPEFIRWMATTLYQQHVREPQGDHLKSSMKVYETLGFPGAYCSADGVHVPWDRAPAANHQDYVGKEGYPTVAWTVSVLHSREIINISPPMSGGRNDKTHARAVRELFGLRSGSSTHEGSLEPM